MELEICIERRRRWASYYRDLITILDHGEYLDVRKHIYNLSVEEDRLADEYQEELDNILPPEMCMEVEKDFLKIQIDYSLECGDKDLFLKSTNAYNNL